MKKFFFNGKMFNFIGDGKIFEKLVCLIILEDKFFVIFFLVFNFYFFIIVFIGNFLILIVF